MEDIIEKYDLKEVCIGNFKCFTTQPFLSLENFDNAIPLYTIENSLHMKIDRKTTFSMNLFITRSLMMNGTSHLTSDEFIQKYVNDKKPMMESLINLTYHKGFEIPSPIQRIAIPYLMDGRDAVIQFKSGTGKTHAFLFGLLSNFEVQDPKLQCIFITSSHEVAIQIYDHAKSLMTADVKISLCIGNKKAVGGFKPVVSPISLKAERDMISNAQIIVGTVGKVYSWLCCDRQSSRPLVDMSYLKSICIDEFDQIIVPSRKQHTDSMRTDTQIEMIIKRAPKNAQRVFISATVDDEALDYAVGYFRQDTVAKDPFFCLLKRDNFTLEGIRQYYIELDIYKFRSENDIIYEKNCIMSELIRNCRISQCIIFVNKITTAMDLQDYFVRLTPPIYPGILHGSLTSTERQTIVDEFKKDKLRYLISTDVTSRGFDVQGINLIINYDMPNELSTYIHRIGRSGRYGKKGVAISIVCSDEMKKIEEIRKCSAQSEINLLPHNLADLL